MDEADRGRPRVSERALAEARADLEDRFERLVREHQDRALGLALRLIPGDRAAAEDVVQDAFVRAHRGLAQFRGDSKLSTWFDRILIREAYRHFRRPWRRWRTGEDPEVHAPPAAQTQDGADPFLRRRIEAALASLSAPQRTVFVLVHFEGYTVNEVAGLLGRSPGTVKSHLHRSLKRLRAELESAASGGGPPGEADREEGGR